MLLLNLNYVQLYLFIYLGFSSISPPPNSSRRGICSYPLYLPHLIVAGTLQTFSTFVERKNLFAQAHMIPNSPSYITFIFYSERIIIIIENSILFNSSVYIQSLIPDIQPLTLFFMFSNHFVNVQFVLINFSLILTTQSRIFFKFFIYIYKYFLQKYDRMIIKMCSRMKIY